MPIIRPSADLRDTYDEISKFCHQSPEPIFITENGRNDLVVMSIETSKMIIGKMELYDILGKGLGSRDAGEVQPAKEMFSGIRKTMKK
ncbi:MAG: antitoxin PHD [Spirochaetales bacterium]|nr:antitoxin PHD [Spirochaetales bacterium]